MLHSSIYEYNENFFKNYSVYTFITFSKASEAALAIEEMNGKVLSQSSNDRLKVCLLIDDLIYINCNPLNSSVCWQ